MSVKPKKKGAPGFAGSRIFLWSMVAFLCLAASTSFAQEQDRFPGLGETLLQLGESREEALREGQENYRAWSAGAIAALTRLHGGEWWVIHFREADRPDWIRGSFGGEYLLASPEEASARADLLKESFGDILICCGKAFGAPMVREEMNSWLVEYPQVVRNVPVEGARLLLRLQRERSATDRERGWWNLEVVDLSVDLPSGLDPRPAVAADGALASWCAAGVPEAELTAEPTLLFCRGQGEGAPPKLCWQVESPKAFYRVDAESGSFLPPVAKTIPLR